MISKGRHFENRIIFERVACSWKNTVDIGTQCTNGIACKLTTYPVSTKIATTVNVLTGLFSMSTKARIEAIASSVCVLLKLFLLSWKTRLLTPSICRRLQDAKVSRASRLWGSKALRLWGFEALRLWGSQAPRLQGSKDPRIQGYKAIRLKATIIWFQFIDILRYALVEMGLSVAASERPSNPQNGALSFVLMHRKNHYHQEYFKKCVYFSRI